jgi:hypothetical protein
MARADAKERERVAWVHGWLTGDDPPPDFSAACKDWGPAVLAHRGISKPTFATTLNSNTVRSIFLDPRTVRPKLLPRGIRLGQSDPVDPCWPLPSRDNAMAAEPAYKPPSVRSEMVNAICASTDCCPSLPPAWAVPSGASIVGALVGSRRRSWMNCSAGKRDRVAEGHRGIRGGPTRKLALCGGCRAENACV